MQPLQLVLLPLLAWVSIGLAQDSGLLLAVEQLPTCALSCLTTAIAQSPCQLTDTACVCTNAKLQTSVAACVEQSCTLRQALTTKNVTATTCNAPIRDKGNTVRVNNIALAVVTNVVGYSRVIYKAAFSIGELGWDDYFVVAALVAGVPSVILIDKEVTRNGLGRDVWTVPFDHITDFVQKLYALEILYFLQIALVKLTLLFFFLRIFPKPAVRRLLWATITFTILWGFSFMVAAIFQCQPISYYWTSWDKENLGRGKCIDINALAWINAAISITLDFWMLALPLYEIFHLQLSWRKKAGVTMMFVVGTFVTVVSILRLDTLVHFAKTQNPTWDQVDFINWTTIEINVGIICACLPSLRVMLVRFFPQVFRSSRGTSEPYGYGSHSQGKKGASAMANGVGRNAKGGKDPHAITYTKTFDIQHTENDEISLVHMDEFGAKSVEVEKAKAQSSSTSVSSL